MGRAGDRDPSGGVGPVVTALDVLVSAGTLLMVLMRWAHALAAIVWLGGGVYASLVLRPRLQLHQGSDAERLQVELRRDFGRLVNGAMAVFVVSGVLLTFDRLSGRGATPAYAIVLAIKVGLALWMFAIAQHLQRRGLRPARRGGAAAFWWRVSSPRTLLWMGAVVVLLAALLKALYERALLG